MFEVQYGTADDVTPGEVIDLYRRVNHSLPIGEGQVRAMMTQSDAFVTARSGGRLVGFARGVCDGARGFFTECKLDPACQGPGAVTRTDGRIEHDSYGIAAEMARRVLMTMHDAGVSRIDVVAWGTEVDFLQELGFKRQGGLIGMSLRTDEWTCGVRTPAEAAS
ncbi:MAG: hypothetical protein HRU75_12460 [Planctomycetia bacterium]|nr:MAG: hypothetical protein HRU75_12460 [Planctomycetia bacterium]